MVRIDHVCIVIAVDLKMSNTLLIEHYLNEARVFLSRLLHSDFRQWTPADDPLNNRVWMPISVTAILRTNSNKHSCLE